MITVPVTAAHVSPAPSRSPRDGATLLAEANRMRAARGLRLLVLDERLCAVARAHGLDMAARHYFEHVSPDGVTPFDRLQRAHIPYGYAGENLALGRDVDVASRTLLESREHLDNIVEPHFARVGIAAVDSPLGMLFVEDFSD